MLSTPRMLQAMKVELGIYSCFAEAAVQEPVPSNVAEASVSLLRDNMQNRKHTEFGWIWVYCRCSLLRIIPHSSLNGLPTGSHVLLGSPQYHTRRLVAGCRWLCIILQHCSISNHRNWRDNDEYGFWTNRIMIPIPFSGKINIDPENHPFESSFPNLPSPICQGLCYDLAEGNNVFSSSYGQKKWIG